MTRKEELLFMCTGITHDLQIAREWGDLDEVGRANVAQRIYRLEVALRQVEEELTILLEMGGYNK